MTSPTIITSIDDPRVDLYRSVRDADLRGRRHLCMAESELVVRRLLNSHLDIHSLFLSPEKYERLSPFIEESLERKREKKNEPRTCDIDIIDYDNKIINFKYNNLDFTVPHTELIFRNFVLYPLKEILPKWKHPKSNEPISVLIEGLPEESKNSILKIKKS